MFDIGWSEVLVIAVVAIIVVGPKELPRMLRTFGRTMGSVRRTANDFKRQFDEALREAERETDLADARKTMQSIGNPLADLRKDLAKPMGAASSSTAPVIAAAPARPQSEVHEAEPLKTGAGAADPIPERGSDAA